MGRLSGYFALAVMLGFVVSGTQAVVSQGCLTCICAAETSPACADTTSCGGSSCGPYKIDQAYWDAVKPYRNDLDSNWEICAQSKSCSENAIQGYMDLYAVSSRLGHSPTCQDHARIHDGGPDGFASTNTVTYWSNVEGCCSNNGNC